MTEEKIYATGKLFELVHQKQPDGRVFEVARRAPGVRIIIVDEDRQKLLLTKEFRRELQAWDYRLPGGKVFDTLHEFEEFRQSGKDILEAAATKAKAEAQEEAGITVDELTFFKKSTLGATVEWDLYVFVTTQWQEHQDGQKLEAGEQVEPISWYDFQTIEKMILRGDIQEDRIALVLLRWLRQHD